MAGDTLKTDWKTAPTRHVEGAGTRFAYRGIGSSGGKAPVSVEDMSRDIIAVVRALGLDHVDLIGFSLGGSLSGRFGSTIP